jgi:hypothetical protein
MKLADDLDHCFVCGGEVCAHGAVITHHPTGRTFALCTEHNTLEGDAFVKASVMTPPERVLVRCEP